MKLAEQLPDDIEDLDLDHLLHDHGHTPTRDHEKMQPKARINIKERKIQRNRPEIDSIGTTTNTSSDSSIGLKNSNASNRFETSEHSEALNQAIKDLEDQENQVDDGLALLPNVTSKRSQKLRKETEGYSNIPGTQTVYIKTYGCSHNQSDSEYMAGLLSESGYAITDNFEDADIYLLNSCTVKNPSQDTMTNLMDKARSTGKPVVVSGCVPQGEKSSKQWEDVSVIGVQQIQHAKYVVEEALKGNKVHLFTRKKENKPSLALPKVRHNPYIEIVPINVGCLNQCTYCKTKHARGDLSSWSIEEIDERIQKVVNEGVKEIRLTSEDTGAYGIDIGTDISQLLNHVVKSLPDGVMLRVGMTNPPYIKKHIAEVAKILNHPNVYSFLHIPIQSGNDKVLYDMKREYTVEDFKFIATYLREHVPHISIATDIICGFPTETDEDFEDTLKLCEEFKFEAVNISQFYPRPGTPAARMKRVPTQSVKERSRKITKLFYSYSTCDYLMGQTVRVWITEVSRDGHHLAGHTKCYVQCLVDPSEAEVGSNVWVKIEEVDKFYVKGHVVPPPNNDSNQVSINEHTNGKTQPNQNLIANTQSNDSVQNTKPSAFSTRGESAKIESESTDIQQSQDSTPYSQRKRNTVNSKPSSSLSSTNATQNLSTQVSQKRKLDPEVDLDWKRLLPLFLIIAIIFYIFGWH